MAITMYDALATRRAILVHARAAHAGEITLKQCAKLIDKLADQSELYGDPIAQPAMDCAKLFKGGDFVTVIIPELMEVAARDDGAIPEWRQSEGVLIFHLEADARALQVEQQIVMRARFPGFPRER